MPEALAVVAVALVVAGMGLMLNGDEDAWWTGVGLAIAAIVLALLLG